MKNIIKGVLLNLFLTLSIVGFSQTGKTILENLKANNEYSTFVKGLEKTGLDKALDAQGEFTVFVPTNRAFEQNKAVFDELFKEENIQMLTQVMGLHLSNSPFGEEEMANLQENAGQEGKELVIRPIMGNKFEIKPNHNIYMLTSEQIGEIYIIKSNLLNSNGTYHAISSCIIEQ